MRPQTFDQFTGQSGVITNLEIALSSAKQREAPFPHTLFSGPSGLGKTTLAGILASEMGSEMVTLHGPNLEKPKDLVGPLSSASKNGIVFIDEVHALPKAVEEFLYTALEDGFILVPMEDDDPLKLELEPIGIMGATTREGLLATPLRNRFKSIERLTPYTEDDMKEVAKFHLAQLFDNHGFTIRNSAVAYIAQFSRGVPRIVVNLVDACRDTALHKGETVINGPLAKETLLRLGYTPNTPGLHEQDLKYLHTLSADKPKGVKQIATVLDQEVRTVEETIEPWLIRQGLVELTSRGRILTVNGQEIITDG